MSAHSATSAAPPGYRVYAIGDIHGRIDLLDEMLGLIETDMAARRPQRPVIIFLGDYIDRGGASRQVVERLITYHPLGCALVYLRGNHEQAMLDFMAGAPDAEGWLRFGGLETLDSYGVSSGLGGENDPDFDQLRQDMRRALPDPHLDFLHSLQFSYELGDYFFAHAGVRPNVPLGAQSPDDLMWIRGAFLKSKQDFGKIVVHGHTIEAEPVVRPNRIGLDTGAYRTHVLSCLVLEGYERAFLFTRGGPAGNSGS